MDEEIKRNEKGNHRGDEETRSQPDHPITSVGRKFMGSTPSSTVGWVSVVACLGALLHFSSQIDSKIDDRINPKLTTMKEVSDEKFKNMNEKIDECKSNISDIRDELESRTNKSSRFDYRGRK